MTKDQKLLIKKHQYASIKFDPAEKMPAPAYCKKGRVHYEVHIAKEVRNDKTKKKFLRTLLLHELGHLECRHLDVNYDKELEAIKEAKERYEKANNVKDEDIRIMDLNLVLNIAGDLEVNSRYLTFGDIKYMTEQGLTPVTLQNFNTTYKEHYYEYYDDVIAALYKMPATPVVIMDMKASSQMGGGGKSSGKGSGKGDKDDKSDEKSESDTVTGVMRSSSDDYDKEMSDENEDGKDGEDKESDEESDKDSNDNSKSKGQGTGNSKEFVARSKKETEDELTKLLLSIKDVKRSKQLDSIRLYNRGTRRNKAGVLYSSVRRKVSRSTDKLGILIDVSGSMNISSVMKSIETIARVAPELHQDTKVKCWQHEKSAEFLVTKIPNRIANGGGTYLPAGLKEFLDEGYDNVVVYSDFCDTLQDYITVFDERPCKLYLVSTEPNSHFDNWNKVNYWEELKKRAMRIIFTSEE